ncbi:hypothetical protein DAD186_17210 [Dermabacter vaginalis]|uniref:Uncharacterized protein n=1 Tax=Dermabacter vaginalis TaxID=1630135 RepID=A0A1B0ZJU0_9MICO|nr:hypothetical protein [Dermabacter vaginalis]ANP28271.1 hypothetical protein DAD186_17210 [Dermabacter vaginalis]
MNTKTWDENNVTRSSDGKFKEFNFPEPTAVDLDGALASRTYDDRRAALQGEGYVQALASRAYHDPRIAGGDGAREDWWSRRNFQGEYSDTNEGYEKMPDDWTPSMGNGKALSGHRRTYRKLYEGAGLSVRMPSASAIKSFDAIQSGKTFDVPVEGISKDGHSVSGWVRCTRTDDGAWLTEGLGFEGKQNDIAEAVGAVLEARQPTKALAGYGSMDERRLERARRYGARMTNEHSHEDSSVLPRKQPRCTDRLTALWSLSRIDTNTFRGNDAQSFSQ